MTEQVCYWDFDAVDGVWVTSCGHDHEFAASEPTVRDTRLVTCPYCEKTIEEG